ncbi:MAG TPA: hypothetical protein VEL47_01785 [Myxococcota bacterium]|nr:hypothetical protein [Myxococcota bacterium]
MRNRIINAMLGFFICLVGSVTVFASDAVITNQINLETSFKITRRGESLVISREGSFKEIIINRSEIKNAGRFAKYDENKFPIGLAVSGIGENLSFYYDTITNGETPLSSSFTEVCAYYHFTGAFCGESSTFDKGERSKGMRLRHLTRHPILLIDENLTIISDKKKIVLVEDAGHHPISIDSYTQH